LFFVRQGQTLTRQTGGRLPDGVCSADAADRGKIPRRLYSSSPAAAWAPMERPKVMAVPWEVATTGETG